VSEVDANAAALSLVTQNVPVMRPIARRRPDQCDNKGAANSTLSSRSPMEPNPRFGLDFTCHRCTHFHPGRTRQATTRHSAAAALSRIGIGLCPVPPDWAEKPFKQGVGKLCVSVSCTGTQINRSLSMAGNAGAGSRTKATPRLSQPGPVMSPGMVLGCWFCDTCPG
jgi:hypothetical protein